MKKIKIFVLAVMMGIMLNCEAQPTQNEKTACEVSFKEHEKDIDTAFDYISNLVFKSGYKTHMNNGGWVEIYRSSLKEYEKGPKSQFSKHCGMLCFFLYNLHGNQKFQLAHIYTNSLEDTVIPPKPDMGLYYISDYDKSFNSDDIKNPMALFAKFVTCKNYSPPNKAHTEDFSNVKDANVSFISQLNSQELKYGVGFFHKQQISDLLVQNDPDPLDPMANKHPELECKGIRIFWGYEKSDIGNCIRLVAVGFDANGNNILLNHDGSKKLILEQSWPPFDPDKNSWPPH